MPEPLPRSYAALIGGTIRDARVATEGGREQLVIELETGAQYAVGASDSGVVELRELQAPDETKNDARPSSSNGKPPAVSLQSVAGAVQDLLRDL